MEAYTPQRVYNEVKDIINEVGLEEASKILGIDVNLLETDFENLNTRQILVYFRGYYKYTNVSRKKKDLKINENGKNKETNIEKRIQYTKDFVANFGTKEMLRVVAENSGFRANTSAAYRGMYYEILKGYIKDQGTRLYEPKEVYDSMQKLVEEVGVRKASKILGIKKPSLEISYEDMLDKTLNMNIKKFRDAGIELPVNRYNLFDNDGNIICDASKESKDMVKMKLDKYENKRYIAPSKESVVSALDIVEMHEGFVEVMNEEVEGSKDVHAKYSNNLLSGFKQVILRTSETKDKRAILKNEEEASAFETFIKEKNYSLDIKSVVIEKEDVNRDMLEEYIY
ncbi:MAG: hypothetical protein N4A47_04055 [Clostridia bacterium]|nr:hypothetical protein [Clostridia bacterium]